MSHPDPRHDPENVNAEDNPNAKYNYESVQKAINRDPRISKTEANKIHRLLAGWRSNKSVVSSDG